MTGTPDISTVTPTVTPELSGSVLNFACTMQSLAANVVYSVEFKAKDKTSQVEGSQGEASVKVAAASLQTDLYGEEVK